MNMKLVSFTLDHLKALPLRAIVAFAARCARRVEPLAQLPEGDPQRESRRQAIEAALRLADSFARGTDEPPDESVVAAIDASREAGAEPSAAAASAIAQAAHAAASAWRAGSRVARECGAPGKRATEAGRALGTVTRITADLAAVNAFTATGDAFVSVGCRNEVFVDAALSDYRKLVRLNLGRYPEVGDPVDPSPGGPLGPL
jgi:hypothetical protein